MKRVSMFVVAAFLAACSGSSDDGGTGGSEPKEDTVTKVSMEAFEFGYDVAQDVIPSGPIAMEMKNVGKQPHQALLYRLNDGVEFGTFKKKVMRDDSAIPQLATGGTDGISEVAGPGDQVSSTGDELEVGTYALICFIGDTSTTGSQNHAELGMIAPLTVN